MFDFVYNIFGYITEKSEEEMLELKNVSFSAENDNGSKDIIKNVSLTIDEGFVALTGPNGGGKSTLAKLIAGIYLPTSGQILFGSVEWTDRRWRPTDGGDPIAARRPRAWKRAVRGASAADRPAAA